MIYKKIFTAVASNIISSPVPNHITSDLLLKNECQLRPWTIHFCLSCYDTCQLDLSRHVTKTHPVMQ
jgi:hypothetical protein